jgi:hypothetical protein
MLIFQHRINIFLSFCLNLADRITNPHDKSGKFLTGDDKILTSLTRAVFLVVG